MISISDNTAADVLLGLVGREAIEAVSPRNAPFLSTREFWILKATANAGLRRDWRDAGIAERRRLLDAVDRLPLPRVQDIAREATLDVEWFFTVGELCALLDATADLPMFRINPGPVEGSRWQSFAYKGGSEFQVLSLAASVVAANGVRHCVAVAWNGRGPLDDARLIEPFQGILHRLSNGD